MSIAVRVAVVGAGISGLSAAWLLSRRFDVTLFEAASYLGGHTNTVDVTLDGVTAPVDTGFLVFNDRTYPNLLALFQLLGVRTASSEMSFSVRVEDERLEWSGNSLAGVFAQKRNLVKPEFWSMLKDIVRFNREATQLLGGARRELGSLGDVLERGRYGRSFRNWYLLPMSGAIWSCPTRQMLDYPAETFLRFCHNHGLLQLSGRPLWRTVAGGGREYVKKLAASLTDVRYGCPVEAVSRRSDGGVSVRLREGRTESFAHVVFACHSDQTLAMLDDATPAEQNVLSRIKYQSNRVVLHTDAALLPRNRETWSAWNYVATGDRSALPVSVSYLVNKLQPLPFKQPIIVSLNPLQEPRLEYTIRQFEYAHPIFDGPAIEAQRDLEAIQGKRHTWYCGAWTGYGFHEDGLNSALAVANALGVHAPWQTAELAA